MEFLRRLFNTDFMPHGHCYFWKPAVLWTNVFVGGVIALSYFVIPFLLVHFKGVAAQSDQWFNLLVEQAPVGVAIANSKRGILGGKRGHVPFVQVQCQGI